MKQSPSIVRTKNEATGMRVVAQYVAEFWECGWQPLDQRVDHGLDGQIIMRKNGKDIGLSVNVQIKCGVGYISSENDDEIKISISNEYQKHIEYWRNQLLPTVLVFVKPFKPKIDKHGKHVTVTVTTKSGKSRPEKVWKESRLKAEAYWVSLKDDIYEGNSLIKIKKSKKFGEHSKGDFLTLMKPFLNKNLQKITLSRNLEALLNTASLVPDAKKFYTNWKLEQLNGGVFCQAIDKNVIISRTGWNHIRNRKRGQERINISLKLLGIAKQMIEKADGFFLLQQKESPQRTDQKLALRAFVETNNEGVKQVQVIIYRRKDYIKNTDKYWFYSVHYRK